MTTLTVNMSLVGVVDTTAPVLTSPTASANGAAGWTGSVSTDEANGFLYWVVTQNATETAATVKAGSFQIVTATGTQNIAGSGLTAETTYHLHMLHRDAAGNDSAVVTSSSFTTVAAPTGGAGTVTATIVRQNTVNVAPFYVHLNIGVTGATASEPGNRTDYDPTHANLWYHVDWGDPGAASDKVVNVAAAHNDLNVGYGKIPAHCYSNPGSYTATVTVRELDGTLVGTDTVAITVNDPDTVFTGNRTILLDPEGVGDSATYPSSQVATTLVDAMSRLDALGTTGRILIKAGATISQGSTLSITSAYANVYIGRYGGSARWTINGSAQLFDTLNSFNSDFVLWGGHLQGQWNSVTETGSKYGCLRILQTGDVHRVILDDMTLDGWNTTFGTIAAEDHDFSICVNNCDLTNWADYGFYLESNYDMYFALLGTAIHQSENANMGGQDKNTGHNQHGPMRIQNPGYAYMAVCDFFSRTTWVDNLGAQACIRWTPATGYGTSHRPRLVLERCALEGGLEVFVDGNSGVSGDNYGGTQVLIDKCLIVGTAQSAAGIKLVKQGHTIRNNIMVQPNAPSFRPQGWAGFITYDTRFSNSADNTSPVEAYNNTLVMLMDDTNRDGETLTTETASVRFGDDWVFDNNAVTKPNATGQSGSEAIDVSQTALTTVGGSWTSRFLGRKHKGNSNYSAQLTMDTYFATPAGSVWAAVPNASSPLVNDATTGRRAYDDFYGTVRVTADRGAVERA